MARRQSRRESPAVYRSPLPTSEPRWNLWIVLFLVTINLLAYAPVWNYGFVNYDDPVYMTQNRQVSRGLTGDGVVWAFTTGHAANWHPLTWLSHMLDAQLHGLNGGAHHLTNLVFHIANTLLLFWAFSEMTGASGKSAFIAALFAVHPLHVESVAWVSERKDVLSTFFAMLALCAYVFYVRKPQLKKYLAVVGLFALGLMAKPMLVTLPFVLLLLDFWPLGRWTWRAWSNLPKLVLEKIPLLVLAAISSIVTFMVQQRGGAMVGIDAIPLVDRVANACIVYLAYLWKVIWPTDLAVLYPAGSNIPAAWPLAALALVALSVLSIGAGPRRPYITVGWFWYLGMLVPVIGLVQVGRQAMADRYTYVPLIGIFIIVAFGTADLLAHWNSRKRILLAASGLATLACIWLTRVQLEYWSSSLALWEHTISVTAENPAAHFNLGADLEERGELEAAMQHYSEALRIEPTYADAHFNLGNALMKSAKAEKLEESGRHLAEALRLKPDFPEAHNGRGVHYLLQGKLEEAISHFSQAIRLRPDYAIARNNLGSALGNQGRVTDAIAEYSEAVRLDPDYAEAHTNLGILLARQGNTSAAITHLSEALRLNSNNQTARSVLDSLRSKNP